MDASTFLRRFSLWGALFAAAWLPIQAEITVSGDFNPTEESFWTTGGDSNEEGFIGLTGEGSFSITGGSVLNLSEIIVGQDVGSTGSGFISGSGSTWASPGTFILAESGTASLTVENGGQVQAGNDFLMSEAADGVSTATFTGAGTSLQTDYLTVGNNGQASLTISNGASLTNNLSATVGVFNGAVGSLVVDGAGTTWTAVEGVNVGSNGQGTVSAQNGATVNVTNSVTDVGLNGGPASKLTVQGAGTTWTSSGDIAVRDQSSIEVLNGAVMSTAAETRLKDGSSTTVRGSGARLVGQQNLIVGDEGVATLNVSQGGQVQMGQDIAVEAGSTANVIVTGDDMLEAGTDVSAGIIFNEGTINLIAGAAQNAGTTSPLKPGADGELENIGTINAIGGTWNEASLTFTVSSVTTDGTGDLSSRRVSYFEDDLLVSFDDSVGTQTFNVTELDPGTIGDETVVDAYDFDTTITELTALSFFIEGDVNLDELSIWYLADGAPEWALFDPEIIDYTDGFLTFTTNTFSGYAVTQVPEPSTAALGLGALALAALRRRYTS